MGIVGEIPLRCDPKASAFAFPLLSRFRHISLYLLSLPLSDFQLPIMSLQAYHILV